MESSLCFPGASLLLLSCEQLVTVTAGIVPDRSLRRSWCGNGLSRLRSRRSGCRLQERGSETKVRGQLVVQIILSDYFIYICRIKNLTVELKNKQDELKTVKEDLRYFQEEKEAAYKQSQVLRNTLEHHCSTLNKAVSLFPFIRSELDSIKEVISSNLENWAAVKEEIFLQIKTVSKEALTEIPKLNQRLAKSQRENECLQEKVKHLTLVADMVELKTQQLQTSLQQGNELQSRCRELQKETLGIAQADSITQKKIAKVTGSKPARASQILR
ncbi:hypothetical protein QYF61_019145 [Mycteria americana]|uniref:Uncharacterized protein n=1 Tax=Mycteria americana TaxID=33587 RepID=A0AAN7P1E7_MYCAM|nr:hypothetical protein QYF61_019145 [Mycteria americana]